MVEVGQMNVRFGADTSGFQQGFSNVKSSLAQTSKNTKSVRADFIRLAGTTSDIARKAVVAFGAAGLAGGIAGIIAKSPALAPAFAQMRVSAKELSLTMGNVLAPAFNELVKILPAVNSFVMENSDSLGELFTGLAKATGGVLDLGLKLGGKLMPALSDVASWFGEHPAIFASLIFGPTAIKGFTAGVGFLKTLGGLAVANPVVAALTAIAGITAATAVGVRGGLVDQFKLDELTPVPITPEARAQIANASPQEQLDLQNRYAARIGGAGFGSEQTPQIDPQTGELYSSRHQQRDIMASIQSMLNNDDSWQAFIRAQQEGVGR